MHSELLKKHNTICYYVLLILVALLISIPLCTNGFIITHDGTAHFSRNYGTIIGIKNGEFLSAIVPNFCGGFGYSWNLFYPPLSTYINAFFYLIVTNYIISMKLTLIFSIICSGIFMFKFIESITKNKDISLIVAIIYITSIYYITDIYMRLAMGEIITYMFLPLLFYGLYNIFYEKGEKNYLLTIGTVGILLSHNISSLIIIILSVIFILIHWKKLCNNKDSTQIWKNLIVNAIFIILIVLFFYVPLLQHKLATEYIAMAENGISTKDFLIGHAINLKQLILAQGLAIVLPLLFTPMCYRKIDKEKRLLYISTLILGLILAFMTTKYFIWNEMPSIFIYIQFPWRLLLFSTFLLSIIAGINIFKCIENNSIKQIIIILIILIYANQYMYSIVKFDKNYDLSYMYETCKIKNIYEFSQQCTNYDYLPVKAKSQYIQNRGNGVVVLHGNAKINNEKKEENNMEFYIECTEGCALELPYIYYLGYNIKLDGKEIEYSESENGFIIINIKQNENGRVEVKYIGTKLSKASTVISIIGIVGFIVYIINERHKSNKIKYSNKIR